jgi:hypothetical protein
MQKNKTATKSANPVQPPEEPVGIEESIKSTDDLLAAILNTSRRLDEGKINVEQARALTGAYKQAIKLIDIELDSAKFTGRTDKTIKRWFPRVASSDQDTPQTSDMEKLFAQFQDMMNKKQGKPQKRAKA